MNCPTCSSENPDVASFCHRCGTSLRGSDSTRAGSYAVRSSEGVGQFALISTIMPHTSRHSADAYRWAMLLSGVAVIGAAAFGFLPIAVAAAAFLVPVTYLVYLYDVNLWEDAPLAVVIGLFVVTGALAAVVSVVFYNWTFTDQWADVVVASGRGGVGDLPVGSVLLFVVLLPVVAEVVKNAGAVLLARLPQFDDMIDGLTFGVAAGTAYAAIETLVVYNSVFTSGEFRTTQGLGPWIVIVLNVMVVKSLIYGTATGIAVATFSGKGEGYDGFTGGYLKAFALSAGVNVLYWVGVRLAAFLPFGQGIGLLWGLVLLGALVLRIRVLLQAALLEAAVEDAAKGGVSESRRASSAETFCPECECMLLGGSHFCIACGTSVRSTSHQARRAMTGPTGGDA